MKHTNRFGRSVSVGAFVVGAVLVSSLIGFAAAADNSPPGVRTDQAVAFQVTPENVDSFYDKHEQEFPVPEGTSLDRVKGFVRQSGLNQSEDTFRFVLGINAMCLWSGKFLNEGSLKDSEVASYEGLVTMPVMRADSDESLPKLFDSLLASVRRGDRELVASWVSANCPA